MKFGIFYELQLPRPWTEDGEHKLYRDALTQVELAERDVRGSKGDPPSGDVKTNHPGEPDDLLNVDFDSAID